MAARIPETISKDEMEQMIYFDQLLYEADQLARERYVVRTARENKALKIAKNFKLRNIPLEIIAESTGLPLNIYPNPLTTNKCRLFGACSISPFP